MSTLVNTYLNEDAQDGDVIASYSTMDMITLANLLEDYNGALQLVQTSPMTISLIAVDVSGLPSTFTPQIYAENTIGDNIKVEEVEISLLANNLPPETVDDFKTVEFGGAEVTFNPATNDTDPNKDTVTVTSVQLSDPTQGEIVLNPDGSVTFTSSDYIGDVTAEYTVSDGRGGISTGMITITVSDTVAPTQTTTITSITDDVAPATGDFGNGSTTNDTTPTLNGTISAGLDSNEVVAIYKDGVKVGEAIVTNGTSWTYADSGLVDGEDYTYTARVEDSAGNLGSTSDEFTITIDTSVPSFTATNGVEIITDANNDGFINASEKDSSVLVKINIDKAEVGDIITVSDNAGNSTPIILTATDIANKYVTTTFPNPAEGATIIVTATISDPAGNTSAPATDSAKLDTSDLTANGGISVRVVDDADNNGLISQAELGVDGKITVEVTLQQNVAAGDKLILTATGNSDVEITLTQAQIDAKKVTVDFSAPANGVNFVTTAQVTDPALNKSNLAEDSATLKLDAPGAPVVVITEDLNNDGFINANELNGQVDVSVKAPAGTALGSTLIISDNAGNTQEITVTQDVLDNGTTVGFPTPAEGETIAIKAVVKDLAGNISSEGNDSATIDTTSPSLSATNGVVITTDIDNDGYIDASEKGSSVNVQINIDKAEVGDIVTVKDNAGHSTPITLTAADIANGFVTTTFPNPTEGSTITVTATIADKAGNVSAPATDSAKLDTNIPSFTATNGVEIITDANNDGFINASEKDSSVLVKINIDKAEVGDIITVSDNAGNSTPIILTATDIANKYVTTTFPNPAEGATIIVTATISDPAGNTSAPATDSATLDATAPTQIIEITSISDDTGINTSDFITDDRTLTINGTLASNLASDEFAQISIDGGKTWSDVSVSGTTWSYVDGRTLADGNYTYDVRIVDLAGNVGDTDSQVVSVGSANDAPVAVDDVTTGVNLGGTVLVSENFENGAKGWTNNSVQNNSATSNFLGNFGGTDGKEGVSKTFNFGTAHAGETVTIEFDVYELGTWDGDGSWNAANEGGAVESFKTFVNGVEVVSHTMGQDGIDNNSDDGGKIISGSAGTSYQIDSHHFIVEAVVDANGQVQLGFGSTTHESASNESFGIDNLTITASQNWVGVLTTDELTPISVDVLANDFDIDGDSLTISEIQGQDVTSGQIVNITIGGDIVGTAQVVNGEIVFTPGIYFQPMKDGELKNVIFDYSISDGKGGSDSANVTINVTGVTQNHAPTDLVTNTKSVDEYAKAGTVVATMYVVDEDLPDDSHTYALSGKDADKFNIDANGTITVKTDGSLYLGCEADAKDQVMTVIVTVKDAAGASYSEAVDIKITNIMENPVKYWNPCSHQDLYIVGGDNNDCIVTGFGNDTIIACAGDDYIDGNCGNDTIYAGSGNDKVYGGSGNDIIYTGLGADWVDGGCGTDTVSYIYSKSGVNIGLDGCKTGIGGDAEGDRLLCVENLIGSNFDDTLKDGCGANTIDGGKGNDNITGGCCDTLIGGEGNDKITIDSVCFKSVDGGEGYDVLNYGNCVGHLDLSNSNSPIVTNIEQINMKDGGWARDTLVLNANGVDKITTDGVLMVTGDAQDQVKLESYGYYNDPTDWTKGQDTTVNGTNYSVYTSAGQTVMIESSVSVVFYNTLI